MSVPQSIRAGGPLQGPDTRDQIGPGISTWWHSGSCEQRHALDETAVLGVRGSSVAVCTYRRSASVVRFLDSLAAQATVPEQLVIIDASPDDATEGVVKGHEPVSRRIRCVLYVRVGPSGRGLTRQRNLALRLVTAPLVTFCDDDIALLPDCLRELERIHHELGEEIVGVGPTINEFALPPPLWRLRRSLGVVPHLQPGSYCRSGMSIPWSFLRRPYALVEGDYLPGCCAMWRTDAARRTGFCEDFGGYAQGEDLDFSLRARSAGKLCVTGAAEVRHYVEPAGRPDHFKLGYMAIYNRYEIHRRALSNRAWRDRAWFAYAWVLDTLLLGRHLLFPTRVRGTIFEVAGRLKATCDILGKRA